MTSQVSAERLPDWDQFAVRQYFHLVLCFPLNGSASQQTTIQHLQFALDRLVQQAPQLGSSLLLGNGSDANHVFLQKAPGKVHVQVFQVPCDNDQKLYQTCKNRRFEHSYVQHMKTEDDLRKPLNSQSGSPVLQVRLFFISGGMFLWIHLHHSLGDGHCLGMIIDSLAAQTQGRVVICPSQTSIRFFPKSRDGRTLEQLFQACPEYVRLPSPTGPTEPLASTQCANMLASKIFILSNQKLQNFRSRLNTYFAAWNCEPSFFACLAVLAWVHITEARIKGETWARQDCLRKGKLLIPIDWSRRCFVDEVADYFGNTAATLAVQVSVTELLEAHGRMDKLAQIIEKVSTAIQLVNQEWVEERNALFSKMQDPRFLGLNHEPCVHQELHFNTWRHLGTSARWTIPGVPTDRPDDMLCPRENCTHTSVLILPDAPDVHRLSISLSLQAMTELCRDKQWTCLIKGSQARP